jgi:hypothetical protein
VTCHSTDCYVYTSLEQTVYQTSNPRRQYHAIRCIRTQQFIWWTRKVECQSDILQWFNNLLLLYDSVIWDKRRILRRNGLLLQEDKPKEIAEWKRVINDYKQKLEELQQEQQSFKVSPTQSSNLHHYTVMHQRWCPVFGLLSHIHITIPCALHFDSNDWNYFVLQLQKVWNYRILRNFVIQYCQPLSTPPWTNSTSQSYCLWKSPAFSTDGKTAVLTMFPRKSCVDVNVYTHMRICAFVRLLIPCFFSPQQRHLETTFERGRLPCIIMIHGCENLE